MPISFNNVEYMVGKPVGINLREWTHIGDVFYLNNNCPVYRNDYDYLIMKTQPLNSEWPAYLLLKTKQEILADWS